MRATRDTFLHFLYDNLGPIPVHPVRKDKDNPSLNKLADDSVNVQFLTQRHRVHIGELMVSIDVIHSEELTAVDWTEQVYDLLSSAFYTPKYDYTNPTSPQGTGTNIYWDPDSVNFIPIDNDPFRMHFNCTMSLKTH